MIQKYKELMHFPYTVTIDEYGERQLEYAADGISFLGAISLIQNTLNTSNNVISETTTHVCITNIKEFAIKDRITDGNEVYTVDYVVEKGRFTRLFLTREVETLND